MTEQEQYLACAELDGYKFIRPSGPYGILNGQRGGTVERLPDYSTRDAVIGVIEKQDDDTRRDFFYALMTIHKLDRPRVYGSTMMEWTASHLNFADVILSNPAQLREALLRATGKWKE